MPNRGEISFRPVTKEDFPLLLTWLSEPHVARWWDPADRAIAKIERHLADESVRPLIVSVDRDPFAYIQVCQLDAEGDEVISLCSTPNEPLPVGTVGLDQFIGPKEKVGIGLGPRFMEMMMTKLFGEGVPAVLVDPHATNIFAIRAYEKAGLKQSHEVDTRNGRVQVMVRYAQEFE
nr:GNAT family N-acetyltransferase [uncultured Cohaesibacter sp.]